MTSANLRRALRLILREQAFFIEAWRRIHGAT
jgi:hypothetical protein